MDQKAKQKELGQMVEELLKVAPDQSIVKVIGEKLGIPYYEDTVAQMNAVLEYMHGSSLIEEPLIEMEK